MSHMVIFRTPEGKPGYQPAETVNDAVAVVERLRNDEGVDNVRIFRLEELTFEYRPYYKVELAGAPAEPSASEPVAVLDEPATETDEAQAPVEDSASDSAVEGAIDVANQEVEATEGGEVADEPSETHAGSQPPWAAPPPPPPPGAPADSAPFGASSDDEEFSTAARRGLFGR